MRLVPGRGDVRLRSIELQHYRNYDALSLETGHMVNVFIGPNAQGKTNLLEAIFVLALSKSHRTSKDKELIGWGHSSARVAGEAERRYGDANLEIVFTEQGKRAKVNGLEQRRLSEFIGTLNVVMFAPEDLEIVKGSPGVRRRFLDMEIGQIHPGYLHAMQQYAKVLMQRNRYLKTAGPGVKHELLDIWDEQLASYGVKMMKNRKNFITKLERWAASIHAGITGGSETLTVEYRPSLTVEGTEDDAVLINRFMLKLSEMREQELRRGVTLVGPHRDDLVFRINGMEAQVYGSQGQQRTTALSLKLAEIELIREEIGEYPVLLLDDVLSELDRSRQTMLIETFQRKVQTFITTTGLESVDMSKLHDACLYKVKDGQAEKA